MNKILNDAHFLTITIVRSLYGLESKGGLMPEQGLFGKESTRCCQEDLSGGAVRNTAFRMELKTLPD